MIKIILKCIIVLLAIQSAMGYLRKQEIIEGSIKINYPTLQRKVLVLFPTEKIAKGIIEFTVDKIPEAVSDEIPTIEKVYPGSYHEVIPAFKMIYHVVHDGETLNELSQRYGVHWRVIKKINHISDEHQLIIGQKLKIPLKMSNLI